MNQQLLRRAWDALDSFKQAYPENWHEEDEQVMVDLMRADMKLSGVQPKWVGLTDDDIKPFCDANHIIFGAYTIDFVKTIEQALREKNT